MEVACAAKRNFDREYKKTFATKSANSRLMQCSEINLSTPLLKGRKQRSRPTVSLYGKISVAPPFGERGNSPPFPRVTPSRRDRKPGWLPPLRCCRPVNAA